MKYFQGDKIKGMSWVEHVACMGKTIQNFNRRAWKEESGWENKLSEY